MRYLRICSLYTSIAMISLILLFLPFLVIAIPEQNYHSGTLTLIPQKNKISGLMTMNASILLKSELVTVFVCPPFALCSTGDRAESPLSS